MFAIYASGLVFADLLQNKGGVKGATERSEQKASLIYGLIEKSDGVYIPTVRQASARSRMNVTFRISRAGENKPDESLEDAFAKRCAESNIVQVKGHRSVGGIRTSLYNAVTVEQTQKLAEVMTKFAEDVKAGRV